MTRLAYSGIISSVTPRNSRLARSSGQKEEIHMKKGNPIALLPIAVFLVLYLGFGILFEYVLKIPMGFYNIPIVVVFLAALLVACL